MDEFKRSIRAIDLAVSAGRNRQSPRTGFVHHFPPDETATDTIPIFENFVFAFALFRQKTSESILEGKELIERLLAFQTTEGNFPIYLHDFPKCWDIHLALKVAPIFIQILRKFSCVLNLEFKEKIECALKKALQFSETVQTLNPVWKNRLSACRGRELEIPQRLKTAQDWLEWLISSQLIQEEDSYPVPFHPEMQVFLGDHFAQEKKEPQPAAIEYVLAEKKGIETRLLRDHPNQLYSALLFPFISSAEYTEPCLEQNEGFRFLWKGRTTIHSLYTSTGKWDGKRILFDLSQEIEWGKEDLFEISFYCDVETSIRINDQKGTVFRLGDSVVIHTPSLQIDLRFDLLEGEGDFCGHISRGNRPGQVACRRINSFEAYDWRIGIRTLRRAGACKISCTYTVTGLESFCKAALSTASPIACIPLST